MNAPAKLRPVHIRVGSRLLRRELLQPGGEPFLFPGQQLLVLLIFFQRIDTVLVGGFDTLFFFGQSAKRFPYKYQFFIFGRSSDKLFAEFKIFFLKEMFFLRAVFMVHRKKVIKRFLTGHNI